MQQINLNGEWKIRWCTGQRGAMPHYIHMTGEPGHADVAGLEKEIEEHYDPCKWINAQVPGEVHQDLVNAGLIAPLQEGTGVLQARWVEECLWFYRRVFDAPKEALNGLAQLSFENLDYAAIIYLNGKEVGRHENAFYPCRIDVSGMLKEQDNVLLVRLESGLFSVCDKPIRDYYTATMTMDTLLHKRNWLRKTQSQMEWDWAPRLMNVGIGGNVSLQYDPTVIVDSIALNTEMSETLNQGKLRCRVFSTIHKDTAKDIAVTVAVAGEERTVRFDQMPEDGILTAEVTVADPKLWWPIGYGEQSLYEATVVVMVEGKEIIRKTRKIGFRRVVVNQTPHPQEGNYFIFEINNQPVFMRGANLVPNDILNVAMTPNRYEKLVSLAIEANFNFLRIWGGGVYESDALYEICDSRGVMLWQEFIAACAVVPIEDEKLLQSFKNEAVHQTRRVSGHPCLMAWCGNNEIGWAPKGQFHAGEDDPLYEEILPNIVKAEDPEKYYQPTSPYSFNGENHNSFVVGDQHPWSVGFSNKDSREYETMNCRFPNEGGILGPATLETIKACLTPGEGMHSFSWQLHDNMLENNAPGSSADEDVRFWFDIDPRNLALEEYVYLGGFVQGEGYKRYIENFRRRKYNSSSAVFWMYNDVWPTTRSWTIVDYYMRKNPSYHPVRRAFEPITVVIANESDGYRLYGVNDTLKEWKGKVTYGIFDVDGTTVLEKSEEVTFAPNASTPLTLISEEKLAATQLAYACLYAEDGSLVARTRYTAQKYRDLGLLPADILIEKVEGGYLLSAKRFVMGVCLDLNGTDCYTDNFFDLFPNQPYFVPADTTEELQILNCLNQFLN